MYQFLLHLTGAFLGDAAAQRPADPVRDPALRISLVSWRAIRLIGLVLALILGLGLIDASRARLEESSRPDGAEAAVLAHPGHVARLRSGSTHRSHKRPLAIPKIVLSNDPNDDGTSGDPDEDDDNETSKFLNNSDDTDVPIMAGCQEMGHCPILQRMRTRNLDCPALFTSAGAATAPLLSPGWLTPAPIERTAHVRGSVAGRHARARHLHSAGIPDLAHA